ncbi:MAG TPA: hypothetical protein PLW74_00885, partial [Candidatus Dojkabacteria bacterium]|nr:hypothetical protein [Candidatus Dojkabacteria bacterium]
MKEYILTQVGPIPEEDITVGDRVEYPNDTYGEVNKTSVDIPWGWIISAVVILAIAIYSFLRIKDRLKRKDRNEKAKNWVLFEVRVPRGNETEIGVAEKMFSNLIGIGGKGKGLAEKFTVNNSISFEVVGTPGLINFYVYCPKKFAEHVEKQILGSYQDADV